MTGLDHLRAKRGQPVMRDDAGLEIADVVGGVMHQLEMPDAALVCFLEALQFHLEKVEAFDVGHDRGLPRFMRGLQFGRAQRPAYAVAGDQLVHPGEAFEVVLVELPRPGRPHHGQRTLGISTEDGPVRHIGEARDRERSRPHVPGEITARRRLRGDSGLAAMGVNIDRDRCAQDLQRYRRNLGCPRRGG